MPMPFSGILIQSRRFSERLVSSCPLAQCSRIEVPENSWSLASPS